MTLRGAYHGYGFDVNSGTTSWVSWKAFLEEYGEADVDYNLILRWDWDVYKKDEDGPAWEELNLVMAHQRRGSFEKHSIRVKKKDEPSVQAYLAKHAEVIARVWAPFVVPTAETQAVIDAGTEAGDAP